MLIRRESDAGFVPLLLVIPTAVAAVMSIALVVRVRLIRAVPSLRPLVSSIREYLSDGRHYLKADLSVFIYMSSDRLFLYVFSTPTVVGLYDAAYKVIQPFYSVSAVVGDAMFLQLTHAFAEGRLAPVFRRYIDLMCVATIPLGFLMTAYSPWLIGLLYGDRFAGASAYLAILGWVITFGYTSGVVVIPFLSWNRPREYGNAILSGSVVNLALNLALIPPFAGIGAAVATVAAKVAVTLAGIRYFWKATSYPVVRDFIVYFAISAVALAASLSAIALLRSPDVVGVLVFGGTYLALAAVTRLPAHVRR
jgi:O-antigen/teichoic acid export membrane protein